MPREVRHIYVSHAELVQAIDTYRKEKPNFLPQGSIVDIEIEASHVLTKIEMKYVDSVHLLDFNIEYERLVDVLCAFCVAKHVPMPAVGKKSAAQAGEEVRLDVCLGADAPVSRTRDAHWPRLRDGLPETRRVSANS
jgi:hypothetical protein